LRWAAVQSAVPNVKRIAKVTFEPRHFQSPDMDHLKTFSFEVFIEGFPTDDVVTGERGKKGEGSWLLSHTSVESQDILPLELTPEADTPDLQGQLWGEEFPGQLWLYQGSAYFSNDRQGLEAEDVRALLNVEANKRRLTLEKAHALQTMSDSYDKPRRRESIPQTVRVEVWQRDRGRCVECDSQEKLEFDHIIPVAMGGGNTSRNLQLLCETCNRRKGASLG
jgi:hypothetical protein